jgi:FkbM family methyltransferase
LPFFKSSIVTILDGKLKGWKWGLHASDFGCLTGRYEPETQDAFIKNIKPNNTVYDLGANVGYFSLLASALIGKNGKVYSFEPIKQNFKLLANHIAINKADNIKVFEFAIADKNKKIVFTNSENPFANTYINSSPMFDISPTIEIEGRSLDSLCFDDKLLPPDFIKMDIEGAEFDALKGAEKLIKQYHPIIYISTHDNHLKGVENLCREFLVQLNYDMLLININEQTPGIKDYIAIYKE